MSMKVMQTVLGPGVPTPVSQSPRFRSGQLSRSRSVRCVAASKPLSGPCIVKMSAQTSCSCSVDHRQDCNATLQEYMSHAAENFANIDLPLGGKITSVDRQHVELVIPRIQLFDVWLQPRALAALSVFPERIEFSSSTEHCCLDGSRHVKEFKLDERFNIDVFMQFQWTNKEESCVQGAASTSTIFAKGDITVEVDIPPPFSYVPKPVLTTTANTALAASLSLVINSFVNRLAEDYAVWANNPELRHRRLAVQEEAFQLEAGQQGANMQE